MAVFKLNKLPKIVLAIFIQLMVFMSIFVLIRFLPPFISPPYNLFFLTLLIGVIASLISAIIKMPKWWIGLQLLFPVVIYSAIQLSINPIYYLVVFILLWLVFSNSFGNRVPLYLTNNKTRQALAKLIENIETVKFIDLGSGLGGNVVYMAKQANIIQSLGVETAPIPYIISKINSLINGGEIIAQDIWKTPLANFNVIYAFLSPEPMERLWEKILNEMSRDGVFISNSFAVPNIAPTEIWELSDSRKTQLYIYRLKEFKK